jgi:hypothetical protein
LLVGRQRLAVIAIFLTEYMIVPVHIWQQGNPDSSSEQGCVERWAILIEYRLHGRAGLGCQVQIAER